MDTRNLPREHTVLAPDGSEIRELVSVRGGSMVHCTLPPGAVSMAVKHLTVEEVWYVTQGRGKLWRRNECGELLVDLEPGLSIGIEIGTHFQFRNTSSEDLCLVIVTMPPWPGEHEAVRVEDYWDVG